MEDLKRQLEMIAECLPASAFKDTVVKVTSAAIAEVERLMAENTSQVSVARTEGRLEALNAVFQINGPSRAVARLREQYAAESLKP